MPRGMAAAAMSAAAIAVRGSVTGRRERIRPATGTSYWIERPRSPATARPTHRTYWTGTGRLRPSDSRRRATASGLASMPSMMRAGSPGSTRTTTKTSRETKTRVTSMAATLRRTCRRNPPCLLLPADLGEVEGRDGQVLPDPRHALLGHDEARVHVEPDRGRVLHEHLLQLHVLLAARLVVERDLGLLEEVLELLGVVAVVVLRVRIVRDVPRLRMPDDRQVVLGLAPHARDP